MNQKFIILLLIIAALVLCVECTSKNSVKADNEKSALIETITGAKFKRWWIGAFILGSGLIVTTALSIYYLSQGMAISGGACLLFFLLILLITLSYYIYLYFDGAIDRLKRANNFR